MLRSTHSDADAIRDLVENILHETIAGCSLLDAIEGVLDAADAAKGEPAFSLLPVWVCRAACGRPRQAVAASAAWHLLYVAAMLLDDVEDGDLAHKSWPSMAPVQAINVATALIFASQLALDHIDRSEMDLLCAQSLRETFNSLILRMCAGQHRDLARTPLSPVDYWQMISANSGVFFSLAYRAGAMMGTGDTRWIERYAEFGHNLGLLIQIGDDLWGTWHPLGPTDLIAGARTLPVVYALSVSPPGTRTHLLDLLERALGDTSAAIEARQVLTDLGALEYLLVEAEIRRCRAREALPSDAESTARDWLIALLDEVMPIPDVEG
jgi:geranylgeranyl pyrophosphate synthase